MFMPGSTNNGRLPGVDQLEKLKNERITNGQYNTAYNFQYIAIDDLYANDMNKRYNQEDIESLANTIILVGLMHNFVTKKKDENGKYCLVSGERRLRACRIIKEKYPEAFEQLFPNGMLPCHVMPPMSEIDEEIALIVANNEVRSLTTEQKIDDLGRLKQLYEMKGETDDVRLTAVLAEQLKLSERTVYRYLSIANLNPIIAQAWRDKVINLSTASTVATFGETEQLMLANIIQEEGTLTDDAINAARELHDKKVQTEKQIEQTEEQIAALEKVKEDVTSEHILKKVDSEIEQAKQKKEKIVAEYSNSSAEMKRLRLIKRSNKLIDNMMENMDKLNNLGDKAKEIPEVSAKLTVLKARMEEILGTM